MDTVPREEPAAAPVHEVTSPALGAAPTLSYLALKRQGAGRTSSPRFGGLGGLPWSESQLGHFLAVRLGQDAYLL